MSYTIIIATRFEFKPIKGTDKAIAKVTETLHRIR